MLSRRVIYTPRYIPSNQCIHRSQHVLKNQLFGNNDVTTGKPQSFLRFNSTNTTYYQVLELPSNATIKEIKVQFKKLSKKYHPDLNSHLSAEEKELNNSKFVTMVGAYDALKDPKKKKQYDLSLKDQGIYPTSSSRKNNEWHNKYYGEAKYYSKSGSHYSASGLNSKRHRVHNFADHENKSAFDGHHINYGDRFDVPHFNYNEHLLKHLKFEQRIINKKLTEEERRKILMQLSKNGDISSISEELITKHLMRQVHHSYNRQDYSNSSSSFNTRSSSTSSNTNSKKPYMYQGPRDDNESGLFKTFMLLGGAGGSFYLLYKVFFH